MDNIELDVDLSVRDLYRFTMRHTYCSIGGVISVLISLACLGILIVDWKNVKGSTAVILAFLGALFIVIQPAMLYIKCANQIRRNKQIEGSLHYSITKKDVVVSRGEDSASVPWYQMRKAVYSKNGLYLYMSVVRAFIFPKEQCGDKYDAMCKMVKECMEKYKDYEPDEQEEADGKEDNRE